MKTVDVDQTITELWRLLVDVEHGEEVVLARNGIPVAKLTRITPICREPGILRQFAGWADYVYDPSVFLPTQTDAELSDEGWPV